MHILPCPAGKHSVKEHYLVSYRKAMAAVVRVQFSASKASAGGRAGALALAENEHIMRSLCCEGRCPGVHQHDVKCAVHVILPTNRFCVNTRQMHPCLHGLHTEHS